MSGCAPHREFLGAIADGEIELVPEATLEHVKGCADCERDIGAYRLLSSRLRQAADHLQEAAADRRVVPAVSARFRVIFLGVAAAIVVGAAGVGWFELSRPDPVQAAVTASSGPMQIDSSDPTQVGQWCSQASGRTAPAIQLDGMRVIGARMDKTGSTDIVTVAYTAPSGARVTVSWLEGQAPSGSGVEERDTSGHEVLIVHSGSGTAVVTGTSSEARWQMAAAIETAAARVR